MQSLSKYTDYIYYFFRKCKLLVGLKPDCWAIKRFLFAIRSIRQLRSIFFNLLTLNEGRWVFVFNKNKWNCFQWQHQVSSFETTHLHLVLKLTSHELPVVFHNHFYNVWWREFGFNKEDRCSIATERHAKTHQRTFSNTISSQVFNICYFLEHLCNSVNQLNWH